MQPLLKVLAACAVRQKKDSLVDGQALVDLPPLSTEEMLIELTEADKTAYEELHETVKTRVAFLTRANALSVRSQALKGLLLKLRMACDHSSLARQLMARLRDEQERAREAASAAGIKACTVEEYLKDAKKKKKKKPARYLTWLGELLAPYRQSEEQVRQSCEPRTPPSPVESNELSERTSSRPWAHSAATASHDGAPRCVIAGPRVHYLSGRVPDSHSNLLRAPALLLPCLLAGSHQEFRRRSARRALPALSYADRDPRSHDFAHCASTRGSGGDGRGRGWWHERWCHELLELEA